MISEKKITLHCDVLFFILVDFIKIIINVIFVKLTARPYCHEKTLQLNNKKSWPHVNVHT